MQFTKITLGSLVVLAGIGSGLALNNIHGQAGNPAVVRPPTELPPTPIGPAPKAPIVPASAVRPQPETARKAAPFDRFRKYDELPEITQQFVFATLRGVDWMTRSENHLVSGRMITGMNPALNKSLEEDHFLRQAMSAFALARAARLTGDERHMVRAYKRFFHSFPNFPKIQAKPGRVSLLSSRWYVILWRQRPMSPWQFTNCPMHPRT